MIMPPQPIDVQYYFYHYLPHFMCILFHRLSVRVQTGFLVRFASTFPRLLGEVGESGPRANRVR